MNLSSLNIWSSFKARRAQQELEIKESSGHEKVVWRMWEHRGWGDCIQWMCKDQISGHTRPLPKEGDDLLCKMESGRVGIYRFTKVNPCTDPSDMWFADVEGVGYAEDEVREK
jgi:hypothetical protein